MCSALPIVVSEGAAKGIVHLDNGWVNRDHDVDSMSEGILRLLEDRPLAVKLAESAKQTIYREFAWKSLCLKIELIYCTIACGSMKKVDRVTE
jgi:glycosyltransferase involved in cell wall biosynthesis